jgi:hypothetical protein
MIVTAEITGRYRDLVKKKGSEIRMAVKEAE